VTNKVSYLVESLAVEMLSACGVAWVVIVDELKGCFSPIHRTCIRAIDSVTCQSNFGTWQIDDNVNSRSKTKYHFTPH